MKSEAKKMIRDDCRVSLGNRVASLNALKNNVLVITGGTGFVGTWLTEMVTFLNDEHGFGTEIVLISRNIEKFKESRPHLASRADVVLMKNDVRFLTDLPKRTHWLIHAAGNPDNRFHSSNPIETMATIADGTAAVIRSLERCSEFKSFLNLSSALIYGAQPVELKQMSETFPGAPACWSTSSVYSEAKRYAETLCAAARSQSRISNTTARPFAFIGPYQGMTGPWAINNFVNDAMSGNPIRVLGDGQTVRSYLYPSDMAVWLLSILVNGNSGSTYNVGSPNEITLRELAEKVASYFSPRPEVRLRTSHQANVISRLVPDVSLATQSLGLEVKFSLDQAIERTIQWNRLT